MFLRAKHIISAITEQVTAGALEIIEIIEKYEEELRLAKEEIDRQRQMLAAAVPQQTPLKDVQRCERQLSVSCEEEIPPLWLHREVKEESDSSDSQYIVYPVSIASMRFEELTECQQTDREDNLPDNLPVCHEAEEPGGSEEAHCSFSQIDVDQMREDEEPKSSPGQAAANVAMDNPEIQQEEEDKEMSSSSNIDDKGSKNTQDDTEDKTMSSTSSSKPLHRNQLMKNLHQLVCMPSSPAQQMKETTQVAALNATEGHPLLSPHLLVAPSQDGRDHQVGQQSHQNQYNCLVCEKGFKYRRSMERHTKREHQNQCSCHVCQKGSKHRRCINRHMACTWIDQMREEETMSSPGEDAANMRMDNPEIQQEEEDVSSSSNIDTCSKNTQDDTEDHSTSSNSSPRLKNLYIPLHRILLMENSGGDCMPSSPAQQMRERSMNGHMACTWIDQMREEETMSSPGEDAANMMDNPEIEQKEQKEATESECSQPDAQYNVMTKTLMLLRPRQSHYSCHVCEKEFKLCISMKRHMQNEHPLKPPQNQYSCHVCGAGFKLCKSMKRHLKNKHAGASVILRRHVRGKRAHI